MLLKESLASSDRVLFHAAVRASLEMGGTEVTRVLTAILPQIPPDYQIVVMEALGSRGDNLAASTLSTLAKIGDNSARVASAHALAAIGSAASVQLLAELIESSNNDVAQAALDGLAGIPAQEVDVVALGLMKSPMAEKRVAGIDLAGRRRMVTAIPALLTAATDPDAKVRTSALQKLGKLGTPAEVPALLNQLSRSTDAQDITGLAAALSSICTLSGPSASTTEQIIAALPDVQLAQKVALLGVVSAANHAPLGST